MDFQRLKAGFIVYFADNVLVMLMATTAGTLGANLFSPNSLAPATRQFVGIFFNTCLAIILYELAASRYHTLSDPTDAAESQLINGKDTAKSKYHATEDTDAEEALSDIVEDTESDASLGYSHIVRMLPWVIIVPMVNIPISLSEYSYQVFASEPYSGTLVCVHFAMFMGFLSIECLLSRIYTAMSDAGSKCESLPTFLLNSFNHSALSNAGMSLHLLEIVIYKAIVGGDVAKPTRQAKVAETLFLLLVTWFLLAECWPQLNDSTSDHKRFKSILMTITVYAWAFALINTLWTFFYDYVDYGVYVYWALMGFCLLVAALLAYLSGNFYGGPGPRSAAFGLSLCWVIDFGVWWGWAQIMTDVDNVVASQGGVIHLLPVNGGMLVGLILVASWVYMIADLQTMTDQMSNRLRHHPTQSQPSKTEHHKKMNVRKG